MTAWRLVPRTLRGRLVLALLGATVVGLFVMGGASLALLEHSLMARVDDRLLEMARPWREGRPPPMPPDGPGERELPTDFRVLLFDRHGTAVGQMGASGDDPRLPSVGPDDFGTGLVTVPGSTGGADWRMHTVPWPAGGTIAVALPLDDVRSTVRQLLVIELAVGAVVLIALVTVAAVTVRLGLRPLTRIEHTANAIAQGDLNRRVADQDPQTETGRLGLALNTMLGRLVAALHQRERSELRLRQFNADASHELRTPLTSIRGFAELYRRSDTHQETDVRAMMSRIEGEAVRMSALVEDLLLLTRLDRERTVDLTDLDLVPLARDVVHDGRARASDREITLRGAEGPVRVLGDGPRIRQILTNLLTNALVHTTAGTPVEVWVGHGAATAEPAAAAGGDGGNGTMGVVEIADHGPGIPPEHAERVFDRFYRVAGVHQEGGSGLGLAITAAIAEAHGGRVELLPNPAGGSTFRMLIPMS